MTWMLTKYLVTAGIVVLISEVAKRSDRLGALIAALPIMTVLTLFWLHFEDQPAEKVANHAYYTFWYVLPTLPMFLLFPWLIGKLGFFGAMAASVALSGALFVVFAHIVRSMGIELLG